jgi:hypothetical protein
MVGIKIDGILIAQTVKDRVRKAVEEIKKTWNQPVFGNCFSW